MVHYKAEQQSNSDLTDTYVHDPVVLALSLQDYLEAQWDSGWELVSIASRGSDTNWMFVFKANAQ